jgi:hypothetical protein
VLVVVVEDLDFRLGIISSSHRRSCKPFRMGSLPLDLRDREKDRPGDLRGVGTPSRPVPPAPLDGIAVGAVVRAVGDT